MQVKYIFLIMFCALILGSNVNAQVSDIKPFKAFWPQTSALLLSSKFNELINKLEEELSPGEFLFLKGHGLEETDQFRSKPSVPFIYIWKSNDQEGLPLGVIYGEGFFEDKLYHIKAVTFDPTQRPDPEKYSEFPYEVSYLFSRHEFSELLMREVESRRNNNLGRIYLVGYGVNVDDEGFLKPYVRLGTEFFMDGHVERYRHGEVFMRGYYDENGAFYMLEVKFLPSWQ